MKDKIGPETWGTDFTVPEEGGILLRGVGEIYTLYNVLENILLYYVFRATKSRTTPLPAALNRERGIDTMLFLLLLATNML